MAEAAKQLKTQGVEVRQLHTGEGGVLLPGLMSTQTRLAGDMAWAVSKGLKMELSRELGGVLVSYEHNKASYSALIPMAHIRLIELA